MNFTNKGKLMTIDELYAIGPAISILIEGYVEEDSLISLRGTLVPATTINRSIAFNSFNWRFTCWEKKWVREFLV
jgi:hypothetical protein